jgi:hypothetical protein
MVSLKFQNITIAFPNPKTLWQAELWIEAEFMVNTVEGTILKESGWCVLELALNLQKWLRKANEFGPDFFFTSNDDEQEGILWFKCCENKKWLVGSAWQIIENHSPCNFESLRAECQRFISQVLIHAKTFINTDIEVEIQNAIA